MSEQRSKDQKLTAKEKDELFIEAARRQSACICLAYLPIIPLRGNRRSYEAHPRCPLHGEHK